jgi:threonine synthase
VSGRFDDCQQMVKSAFTDADLQKALFLTSANSINVARWLPQQFYYFYAWQQWADKDHPPVISVPSGNFGNICAGILAHQSGLPVKHFIAACNANDIVPQYLKSGTYQAREAVATLSNAMDVGNPSNFVRVLEIFKQEFASLKGKLHADAITDAETKETLARVYRQNAYLLDPHGAVGFLALERYLQQHEGQKGYLLETAHPVKFPDAVEEATEKKIEYPGSVQSLLQKEKKSIPIEPHFAALKDYLLSR